MERVANRKWTLVALEGLLLILVAGFFSTTLFGQNATFTGRVTDRSGAVVPKAQITVHNQDTGVEVTTNALHGDTYEYLRRTWLEADTWVNDAQNDRYLSCHCAGQSSNAE